jgi:Flp pilus assembly protein CpaB
MRNTIFLAAVAAAALLQVGIVEWANSHKGALEAQASTQTENVNLDPSQMMLSAKNLPSGEFEDFSLVFPSPVTHRRIPANQ